MSDKYSLWWIHRVKIFKESVRPSTYSVKISGDLRSLLEFIRAYRLWVLVKVHEPLAIILLKHPFAIEESLLISSVLTIRDHPPYLRTSHAERHFCFETWLVEARKDSVAVESFELRVKILLTIRLIDKLVKTRSVFLIRSEVLQTDDVPALPQVHHLQPDLLTCKVKLIQFWVLIDSKFTDG